MALQQGIWYLLLSTERLSSEGPHFELTELTNLWLLALFKLYKPRHHRADPGSVKVGGFLYARLVGAERVYVCVLPDNSMVQVATLTPHQTYLLEKISSDDRRKIRSSRENFAA